jgi:hypothetical protein
MSKLTLLPLLLACAVSAYAGPVSPINPNPDSSKDAKSPAELQNAVTFEPLSADWTLSAGYQWRDMGSLNFHTGSAAAHSSIPWVVGGSGHNSSSSSTSSFGNATGAGSATATANRTYSDGFVNQDSGTPIDGSTGFFGYNNQSQVTTNNLSYHNAYGTTNTTTSSVVSTSNAQSNSLRNDLGWNSDVSGSGFFATLESPALLKLGTVGVSLELSYSFATADTSHFTPGVFTQRQSSISRSTAGSTSTTSTTNLTDNYDTTGLFLPSAPFVSSGTGPGPLINNVPTSRSTTNSTSTSSAGGGTTTSVQSAVLTSNVNEGLRMKLNTLSFGPHGVVEWGRLSLGLSAGFALNIADWDSTYREELSSGGRIVKAWQYENNGLKALPGAYTEINANFRLTKHWALFAGGRYDWAGTLHGDDGPSTFAFKVRGASVQGGITFAF